MSLLRYALRRAVFAAVTAVLVVSLTFLVVATNRFYPVATPLAEQYVNHLSGVLVFDWGTSTSLQRPVGDVLAAALPRTLAYLVPAVAFAYALGIAAGLANTYWDHRLADAIPASGYVVFGVPTTVLGAAVAFWLYTHTDWGSHPAWCMRPPWTPDRRCYPPFVRGGAPLLGDAGAWPNTVPWRRVTWRYVIPAGVLAVGLFAGLLRHTRNAAKDYRASARSKMLRAKGGGDAADARHALRNAALPLLSVSFAELMSSLALWTFVVEAVFHVPGVAAFVMIAVRLRDLPLLVGTTTVLALVGVGGNLLQDLLYGYLHPEIGE